LNSASLPPHSQREIGDVGDAYRGLVASTVGEDIDIGLAAVEDYPPLQDYPSSSDNDEQPLSNVCTRCETLKAEVEGRDKRIASLEAQLQDFGVAVVLFGSGALIKSPGSSQGEVDEQQIVRSALLILEYRKTGKFEDVCDLAVRILEDEPSNSVGDDPQQNIRNALQVLGLRMTGRLDNPHSLARRVFAHGDWELNMAPLPPICLEQRSTVGAATLDHLPWNDSGYGYCEARRTVAPTITNTETQGSWLGSSSLVTKAEPGDQQVPCTIQAFTETPNHNGAFLSESSAGMSRDPFYNWNADSEGPWIPKPRSEDGPFNPVCPKCHKIFKTISELKYRPLENISVQS
jgi:hypothetical protein